MNDETPASVAYLDHAATTPIYPEVVDAMAAQLARLGNASSLHGSGRAARRVVEESREAIAAALGSRPSEVVFTSGGTEADNLAIKGFFWSRRQADPRRTRILTSAIEHHAVLDPLQWLAAHEGAEVELMPVARDGRLDIEALRMTIERSPESVALVSVMWANNEVGTVQPIHEVVALASSHGIPVHSDAVQALGQVPLDFASDGLDAMTVTGHKVGGPFRWARCCCAARLILWRCFTGEGRSVTCGPELSTPRRSSALHSPRSSHSSRSRAALSRQPS
ncbi:MAG: aminotransferase class V-fold PLP-dependent enzyme [Nocardioidaceae bacterium]